MVLDLRVSDLVPKRYGTLLLWFVLCVGVIAGLECLYFWMPRWASMTTDGRVAAFDLDGEGSLAAYFSSLLLGTAGLISILIYRLRRHRIDDYYGRYRVWFWAALCWFVMSLDESASLHEGFKEMMSHLSGRRWFGDGSVWWIGAYGVVLSLVGLQVLYDMRRCWSATGGLLISAACFAAAVVMQLKLLMPDRNALAVMIEEGCEMAGALFLLLSVTLYARQVIRTVVGKGKSGKKRRKGALRKKGPEAAGSSSPSGAGAAAASARPSAPASAPPAKGAAIPAALQAGKTQPSATASARTSPPVQPDTMAAANSQPAKPAPAAKPAEAAAKSATPAGKTADPSKAPGKEPLLSRLAGALAKSSTPPASTTGTSKPTGEKPQLRPEPAHDQLGGSARKMSKAERKALKRALRAQRAEREDDEDE